MKQAAHGTLLSLTLIALSAVAENPIVVGSKNFTEGYLLAEVIARTLEAQGFVVERRLGLGGTKICFDALVAGEIDVYPEYTGTLRQVLLDPAADGDAALRVELAERGLAMLPSFGFNNTYALAMDTDRAADLGSRGFLTSPIIRTSRLVSAMSF